MDEWKGIYTASLSKTSLQSIAKYHIDELLSERMVRTLAQNVRNDISQIVAEAAKYARRTRSAKIQMEHLLFAMEEHSIGLDLLYINYVMPESETKKGKFTFPVMNPEYNKPLLSGSRIRSTSPDEITLGVPTNTPRFWLKREKVLLMANKKFPLSQEQQEFYVLITETCMGTSEPTRREALQRLAADSSLQPMLSKLSLFISEAVKVNVVQQNFALLIYLMRMVHSLLANPHLGLSNYLHLLIPAVLSCTVAHQLCAFPAVQNHWALREYSANIMAEFVGAYESTDNSLMPRVFNIYKSGLRSSSLTTIYGSIIGLGKMGKYAVRAAVIPQIHSISALIELHLAKDNSDNDLSKQGAIYIRHRLLKMCAPILKNIHAPPDTLEAYSALYGFLGCSLCDAVVIERIIDDLAEETEEEKIIDFDITIDQIDAPPHCDDFKSRLSVGIEEPGEQQVAACISMSKNVGTIRLKNLSELQTQKKDNVDDTETAIYIEDVDTTPEKPKKARKVRAATTTKKKINDETKDAQLIASSTAIKRTGKKEPLPGQLRIDAFFKSSTKSYKVEEFATTSPGKQKPCRQARKGCKRLFDEESITAEISTKMSVALSDVKNNCKPTRKRTQPQRKAKAKCTASPGDFINLCSDDESEAENNNTSVNQNETKSTVLSVLEETPPMVKIPRLNVQSAIETDASSNKNMPKERKRKRCPSYKVVEDTTFVVDGFQFGDIPNATHYFLSHYHADHYVGLTRKFAHPLYMSPITASLVRVFIPIDSQYLHEIEVGQSIEIDGIEVTAIDANHCPGAIMLLFKFSTGKCILHTGDFRASFEMESLPIFWNQPQIDLLYLDTTYLSKNYDFCHQSDSIYSVCALVRQFHEKHANKRILHVCGSYLIGKEKVWLALVEEFALRVWTEPHRRKAIDCLNQPELQLSLCDDPFKANLHVINMGKISYPHLDQYFKQFEGKFDMLLGIRPSGWEKNSKPSFGKRISVIGVEYSEHSSYKELERFVRFLKPKNVISTVPVGRDLCVTATVPTNWYKYSGYGGMISKSFQPSISTFLETPQRKLPSMRSTNTNMKLSPIKNSDATNADDVKSCVSIIEEPIVLNDKVKLEPAMDSSTDAAPQPCSRFASDASDDLLTFI